MAEGIDQDRAEGAEEERQVGQLVDREHRAGLCRAQAAPGQQRHQGQRPAAAARSGAESEFAGHDDADALQLPELAGAPGEQQAQAQAVDEPADHDHAEHQQQTVQREGAQAREHVAAAEHQRNQRGTDQTEQQ